MAAALVTIVLVALMTGILIGVAYLRFNRAKCTDVTKTYLPRFKTVNIGAKVPEKYNTALKNLISAVDLADQIFLQQVSVIRPVTQFPSRSILVIPNYKHF